MVVEDSPCALQHGLEQFFTAFVECLRQQGLAENIFGFYDRPSLDKANQKTAASKVDMETNFLVSENTSFAARCKTVPSPPARKNIPPRESTSMYTMKIPPCEFTNSTLANLGDGGVLHPTQNRGELMYFKGKSHTCWLILH